MYSSTFIFATRQLDDDFHQLDQAIAIGAQHLRDHDLIAIEPPRLRGLGLQVRRVLHQRLQGFE